MSSKLYDILKGIALIWLPALATFWWTLGGIWDLPYTEQVIGTIVALDTLLGVVVKSVSKSYKPPLDGKLIVDDSNPDKVTATFDIATKPEDMIGKDRVTVAVVHPEEPLPPGIRILPPSA
jgi:Putative phage holin Dp-1